MNEDKNLSWQYGNYTTDVFIKNLNWKFIFFSQGLLALKAVNANEKWFGACGLVLNGSDGHTQLQIIVVNFAFICSIGHYSRV